MANHVFTGKNLHYKVLSKPSGSKEALAALADYITDNHASVASFSLALGTSLPSLNVIVHPQLSSNESGIVYCLRWVRSSTLLAMLIADPCSSPYLCDPLARRTPRPLRRGC